MSALKHCQQRGKGSVWFFQRVIPSNQRRLFPGRLTAIEVSLGTDSAIIAEKRRAIIKQRVDSIFAKAKNGQRVKESELESLRGTFGRRGPLTAEEAERLERQALHAEHDALWRDPLVSPDLSRMLAGQHAGTFAPLLAEIQRRGLGGELAEAVKADDADAARDMLKSIGVEVTDKAVSTVAEGIGKARARALIHFEHKRDLPPLDDAPARRRHGGKAPKVSEAAKAYVEYRQRDKDAALKSQTVAQMKSTYRLFAEHVRDARLDEVTDDDALSFLDTIARLHRDYGHRPGVRKLSLADLLRRYPAGDGEGPSNKTLNRHQSALKTLFTWASSKKGKLLDPDAPNPFEGLWRKPARSSKVTYQPFEDDELSALFKGARFDLRPKTTAAAMPWIMATALYSGMRLGEICKLDGADLKPRGGIWYFDLIASKTEAGIREVPIHSKLIDLGLLNLAKAAGRGLLFDCIKPTGPKDGEKTREHAVSKAFPEYRRERGVERERGHAKGRVAFHSFRKNFVGALETAGVQQDAIKQIVGHEREFTSSTYNPQGLPMAVLRDAVESVRYPVLKLKA